MKREDIPERYRLPRDENDRIKTKDDNSIMYNLDCTIGLFLETIFGSDLDTSISRLIPLLDKIDNNLDTIIIPEEKAIEYKKRIIKCLDNIQSGIRGINDERIKINKEIIENNN